MNRHQPSASPGGLPKAPIERLTRPLVRFMEFESASGVLLLACTALALYLANSPWAAAYARIWQTPIQLTIGNFEIHKSLLMCINDGLMTLFFFVVGLEIKRELVAGELREARKAALPIIAALGGMVVPAAIYLALRFGRPGQEGWGVPVATDIAFVVGFLALFGKRVPIGLKIMMLTLAIADDIGAVLVIALFYSTQISFIALGIAAAGFALTFLLNWIGVRRVGVYVLLGIGIWFAFLKSGVHPTVAGVLLGLLTPATAWIGDQALFEVLTDALHRLRSRPDEEPARLRHQAIKQARISARESVSPLHRLQNGLGPWVSFVIMPLFALANAGVEFHAAAMVSPVAIAVAAGLLLGKPIGIVLFSWMSTKLGVARLPSGVTWKMMVGSGCLAGIGFTMSIFIAGLALKGDLLNDGKIGTLMGSAVSAALGCALLLFFLPRTSRGEGIGSSASRP